MVLKRISGQNLIAKVAVLPMIGYSLESQGLKWMPSQGKATHHGRTARAVGYLGLALRSSSRILHNSRGTSMSGLDHPRSKRGDSSRGVGTYMTLRPNPAHGATSYIKIRKWNQKLRRQMEEICLINMETWKNELKILKKRLFKILNWYLGSLCQM